MATAAMEIKVAALQRTQHRGTDKWQLYWTSPETGKRATRSIKAVDRAAAEREALKVQGELVAKASEALAPPTTGTPIAEPEASLRWCDFIKQYRDAEFDRMKPASVLRFEGIFTVFGREAQPRYLSDITTSTLDRYKNRLRKLGRSEATIATHSRHLKTALQWGHRRKLVAELPDFGSELKKGVVRRDEAMRGRPITDAEFEFMVQAIPKVITVNGTSREAGLTDDQRVESWEHLLRGLWLSGLRSGEAFALRWDDAEPGCLVNQTGDSWSIRFPKGFQKNSKRQDHPITPDFQKFLEQTPVAYRQGFVFKPQGAFGSRPSQRRIEATVRDFGRTAWIKVSDLGEQDAFAGCHTLRRSFGTRWSKLVTPSILRRLMRHSSIVTTERFYIDHDLDSVAAELQHALRKAK